MITSAAIESIDLKISRAKFASRRQCVLRTPLSQPQIPLVRNCFSLVALIFSLLAGLHCLPAMADDDGWQDFNSSKYHFKIKVPGDVKESVSKDTGLPVYTTIKDHCQYLVIIGDASKITGDPTTPQYIDALWGMFKLGDKTTSDPEDVSGKGWKGKTFKNAINGKQFSGMFAVGTRGYLYCLLVDDAAGTENRDKFIDSLAVDSGSSSTSDSSASDSSSTSSTSTTTSSDSSDDPAMKQLNQQAEGAGRQAGEALAKALPWLIVFFVLFMIFLVGVIVLVVWLVKRNNNKRQ